MRGWWEQQKEDAAWKKYEEQNITSSSVGRNRGKERKIKLSEANKGSQYPGMKDISVLVIVTPCWASSSAFFFNNS